MKNSPFKILSRVLPVLVILALSGCSYLDVFGLFEDDVPTAQYGLALINRAIPTKLVETFAAVCRETLLSQQAAHQYFVQPPEEAASSCVS